MNSFSFDPLFKNQVAKSGSGNVNQLGQLGATVTHLYTQLATDTQGAVAKTQTGVDIAMRIKSSVHELGRACIDLVKTAGARQGAPNDDVFTQRDLSDAARLVGEKVKPRKDNHVFLRLELF